MAIRVDEWTDGWKIGKEGRRREEKDGEGKKEEMDEKGKRREGREGGVR